MGKNLKEEDLRLNIIVNGDPARKEIGQLTRSTKDLRSENGRLLAEQKKLRAEGGENKARIAEITATIKKNSETIKANEARIKQLRSEMKVTSMTTAELSQRHAELRNAMRNVVPGTPQWKLLRNELQAVTGRMAQLRTETTVTEGVMCRMATNVNKYIGTVTASFAALAMYGSFTKRYRPIRDSTRLCRTPAKLPA
jgi:methyl-accepting chemotaxis protein